MSEKTAKVDQKLEIPRCRLCGAWAHDKPIVAHKEKFLCIYCAVQYLIQKDSEDSK